MCLRVGLPKGYSMRCGMNFKSELLLKGGSHSAGPYVYAIHFKNGLLEDLLGMC